MLGGVSTTAIAMALKPFALLAVLTALAAVRYAVIKWMPESRVKRILLKDV